MDGDRPGVLGGPMHHGGVGGQYGTLLGVQRKDPGASVSAGSITAPSHGNPP